MGMKCVVGGCYINYYFYDGSFDLLILINEPNDLDKVNEVLDYLDEIDFGNVAFGALRDVLESKYFPYGVQMLLSKGNYGTYTLVR